MCMCCKHSCCLPDHLGASASDMRPVQAQQQKRQQAANTSNVHPAESEPPAKRLRSNHGAAVPSASNHDSHHGQPQAGCPQLLHPALVSVQSQTPQLA
jgi:hypothetical protein